MNGNAVFIFLIRKNLFETQQQSMKLSSKANGSIYAQSIVEQLKMESADDVLLTHIVIIMDYVHFFPIRANVTLKWYCIFYK